MRSGATPHEGCQGLPLAPPQPALRPALARLPRAQLDDVVSAVPMHMACGVMGTLFVGFFARQEFVEEVYGPSPTGGGV